MKTILSLSSLFVICVFFSSCVKSVDVIAPPPSNSLSGTWYISDASAEDNSGWYSFDAGVPGIFTFYNDGTAQYADNNGNMQGSYTIGLVATSYYDEYGNYKTDQHNNFEVHVSNSEGGYVDLEFDDISFAGNNRFTATYYDGKSIERYTFDRY